MAAPAVDRALTVSHPSHKLFCLILTIAQGDGSYFYPGFADGEAEALRRVSRLTEAPALREGSRFKPVPSDPNTGLPTIRLPCLSKEPEPDVLTAGHELQKVWWSAH